MPEMLRMPEVSANLTEAIVATWNVEVGEAYRAGDAIVSIETDKAIVDVEAESDGTLLKLLVREGQTAEVGAPIAVWGAADESEAAVAELLATLGTVAEREAAVESQVRPVTAAVLDAPLTSDAQPQQVEYSGETPRVFASPIARAIARREALPLDVISGSGPRGRIRRRDVEVAIADRATRQEPPVERGTVADQKAVSQGSGTVTASSVAEFEDVPNTRMREAIARRLTESKQTVPHFYVRGTAKVDRLLALRRELNDGSSQRVSVNDLVVKAVAVAHTRAPSLNVQWREDSIRHFRQTDVAVAIATQSGLVTPVLRGVDGMSISQVAQRTRDLVERAGTRKLQQSELEGGSIAVTNLGMYGTEEFAAIINPPQAAILAVGAASEQPVAVDGEVVVATVLRLCLAVDHRPVDGAMAAEWMTALIDVLEHPLQILA